MLLLLFPQGSGITGVDLADTIAGVLPALGAATLSDLDWTSQTELYQWADDAARRLAHRTGFWVERAGGIAIASGDFQTSTPARHVATIHVSLDDVPLRPSSSAELEALSPTWSDDAGIVERFSMDGAAPGQIRLYRKAAADGTLAVIYREFQPTIASGSSTAPVPTPVADYFGFSILAEARRKESDAAMPEMAAHFDEQVALYEKLIEGYWGPGQ